LTSFPPGSSEEKGKKEGELHRKRGGKNPSEFFELMALMKRGKRRRNSRKRRRGESIQSYLLHTLHEFKERRRKEEGGEDIEGRKKIP